MTTKELYSFLKGHNYVFTGTEWKQGNKKFNPYTLAQAVLPFCEGYEDATQLLIDISKLEKEYSIIEEQTKANKSERIASFIEAYTSYIASDDIVSPVDIAIWGQSCTAQRENEDKYYVKPTGIASEYEEVADDLGGIGKTFADEIVYSKKYGKIKRGKLFQLIFNQLIKDFPIDNPNFAKAKDLEHPCLSPVILKNFIELVTVKDKGEILGYKLVAKVTTTVQDYYTKSSGVVAGSMRDIGTIKPLSNSIDEPCLKYFDIEAICNTDDSEYPSWDNFMGQMRCKGAREVFMAWVYSVFYEKNHSPQCMWLSDRGGLGKSTIIKALQHYTGKSMGTISDKTLTSDFGTETILGKRLVVNADCKKPSVIHSELLHNITTFDPQIINRKHKSQFTGNIYSKVLICSNHAPNLHTSEHNQTRRIIYIKMTAPPQEEMIAQGRIKIVDGQVVNTANVDRFLQQLIAEFPAFMKDARKYYRELCQNDNEIHLCPEMKAEIGALNDTTASILSDVLETTIKVVPLAEAIASKVPLLDIVAMRDVISMELGRDLNDSDNFRIRDLLNNLHGLDNLNNKVRVNDKLVRCITGQEKGTITVAVKKGAK